MIRMMIPFVPSSSSIFWIFGWQSSDMGGNPQKNLIKVGLTWSVNKAFLEDDDGYNNRLNKAPYFLGGGWHWRSSLRFSMMFRLAKMLLAPDDLEVILLICKKVLKKIHMRATEKEGFWCFFGGSVHWMMFLALDMIFPEKIRMTT